jgi:magnesium transporter
VGKKSKKKVIRKRGLPPGALVYTGDREVVASTATSISYTEAEYVIRELYAPELRAHSGWLWIDIRSVSDAVFIERVGKDFQIHPLALEDVLNTQQRAKIEEYDGGLFLVLPNLRFDAAALDILPEQIAVYIGSDYVISFQEDPDDTFASVRSRLTEGAGRMRKRGADYLGYALCDMIVDHYYFILDDIEAAIYDIETDLHNNGATLECKGRIFQLKHTISLFRLRMLPLREAVLRFYRTDSPLIEESTRPYLRDLADHVAQIIDGTDNFRDLLSNLEAMYQAEITNRMNNVMKLLTVISTIFIPLSFIAGIYGMNFDHMPELHWRYGYFIVLAFMFGTMAGMLVYFKRKRWI